MTIVLFNLYTKTLLFRLIFHTIFYSAKRKRRETLHQIIIMGMDELIIIIMRMRNWQSYSFWRLYLLSLLYHHPSILSPRKCISVPQDFHSVEETTRMLHPYCVVSLLPPYLRYYRCYHYYCTCTLCFSVLLLFWRGIFVQWSGPYNTGTPIKWNCCLPSGKIHGNTDGVRQQWLKLLRPTDVEISETSRTENKDLCEQEILATCYCYARRSSSTLFLD